MDETTVSGAFDDLRSRDMRYLQEIAKSGSLKVLLWSDEAAAMLTGHAPKFPVNERKYLLESLRFVDVVEITDSPVESDSRGLSRYLGGFPSPVDEANLPSAFGNKAIVTGCYDWLHSGHVRFFEEAAQHGDLYVVIGSDANVRLLKGEGHPLFPQEERKFQVECIRFVRRALISTGSGWMDAAPEIERIDPQVYVVNEDGDKPEKRAFCKEHGLEYIVLKRTPKEGLPTRESTVLRGF